MSEHTQEPKPQPVNWEAVRVLAMAVGVREAARRMGISEDATRKRCQRERWLGDAETREQHGVTLGGRSGRPMSQAVVASRQLSPAAVMAMELASLGQETRLSFARGMRKAAKTVETMDGDELLLSAQNVKAVAQTANLVHGWSDQVAPKMRLDVVLSAPDSAIVDIDATAEVIDQDWS